MLESRDSRGSEDKGRQARKFPNFQRPALPATIERLSASSHAAPQKIKAPRNFLLATFFFRGPRRGANSNVAERECVLRSSAVRQLSRQRRHKKFRRVSHERFIKFDWRFSNNGEKEEPPRRPEREERPAAGENRNVPRRGPNHPAPPVRTTLRNNFSRAERSRSTVTILVRSGRYNVAVQWLLFRLRCRMSRRDRWRNGENSLDRCSSRCSSIAPVGNNTGTWSQATVYQNSLFLTFPSTSRE